MRHFGVGVHALLSRVLTSEDYLPKATRIQEDRADS